MFEAPGRIFFRKNEELKKRGGFFLGGGVYLFIYFFNFHFILFFLIRSHSRSLVVIHDHLYVVLVNILLIHKSATSLTHD